MMISHWLRSAPGPRRGWRAFVGCCFASVGVVTLGGCAVERSGGTFVHGAVAADHATASEAGAEMLRKGGNAVDAAVAASFTLSVVRPESCGIGGGGFMVVRLSDAGAARLDGLGRKPPSREVAINYREVCPAGVGPDFYEKQSDPDASTHGGAAAGVPGTVAGLLFALEHYGTLDRETVMAPAIRAAERGFQADAHYVEGARALAARFEKRPEWKQRFAFVWERYLRRGRVDTGDLIKVPEQALVLRMIAERGAPGFYEGDVAHDIAATVRADGGALSETDLGAFKVSTTEPLSFTFMAWQFLTMPPPSSGGVAMGEAMGIFEVLYARELENSAARHTEVSQRGSVLLAAPEVIDLMAIPYLGHYTPETAHALIEASKHAFADRARWLADPAFVGVPSEKLVSREYAGTLAASVNRVHTQEPDRYGTRDAEGMPARSPKDHGTSHLSVVDADGSAVACTETVNLDFGSCVVVPRYGILLNDQMDDFTTRRGRANAFGLVQSERNLPEPGKRPLSSMTPTIVVDESGHVAAVAGASGGPRIISGTMQVLLGALLWGEPAAKAVAAPRFHHQWQPDVVLIEREGLKQSPGMAAALERRGHRVEPTDAVGNVQFIKRTDAGWEASCDPRKGGRPAGY